jgi:Zn/Cd-binding protein ZinT
MLDETEVSSLLGRALSAYETDNFDLYLNIATVRLEELLCVDLTVLAEERTYMSRDGYRTVYVDPFVDIASVKIGGNTVSEDDYTIKQNDSFNGTWYNIIEFDSVRRGQKLVINGTWGFNPVPDDLQLLLASIFDQITSQNKLDRQVNSKKIEDYTITFNRSSITMADTLWQSLVKDFGDVISKYEQCNQGVIRNGRVRRV